MGSVPGSGKSFGGGNSNALQLSLPGETHRQRSLAGYIYGVAKSWIQLKQLGMHREAEGVTKLCRVHYLGARRERSSKGD